VDILETIRVQQLTMSPSIVGWLKMLVTLGALRHQLAVNYDLAENVRRFVRRLARQQGLALADPRQALDRLYSGAGQVKRALDFLEFLEGQESTIIEATSSVLGIRNRFGNAKRTIIRLGTGVLVVGAALYLILQFPDDTKRVMPIPGSYEWVNVGLLVLLLILIVALINYVRRLGQND